MPKPYPATGKPAQPATGQPAQPAGPERPSAPPSVLNAVRLMYAGAVATVVSLVLFAASTGAIRNAAKTAHPRPSSAQVNSYLTQTIAYLAISVALWLWMARANGQGKNWARITSTVLFALATLDLLFGLLLYPKTLIGLLIPVVTWLVGLGAVILLWRRESTAFFKPAERRGRG